MKPRPLLGLAVLTLAVAAACGSGVAPEGPTPVVSSTTTPVVTSSAPVPTSPPASDPSTTPSAAPTGARSATCVNGWMAAPTGSDFYRQAEQAVQDTLKGSHPLAHVRYFAGPLVAGGIGAAYYVELTDTQLPVRMVIVSGGGPSTYAVAPVGTHGWTSGDWTGFSGTEAPSAHPPLPGTWAGPAYDPVTGTSALLSPQLAGCLAGT